MDIAQLYTKVRDQRLQVEAVEQALQEILTAAVSAEREGDDAKKLSKKDVESAIKIAVESASEK